MTDTQRAVELLNSMRNDVLFNYGAGCANKLEQAIALLEPPKLSKHERIAMELEAMSDIWADSKSHEHMRNIAAILRETT